MVPEPGQPGPVTDGPQPKPTKEEEEASRQPYEEQREVDEPGEHR